MKKKIICLLLFAVMLLVFAAGAGAERSLVIDEAGLLSENEVRRLEEKIEEIRDEYDEDEKEQFKELAPGEYLIEASMKLDDVNDLIDTDLASEDYDSLGGFVIGALDHLPEKGESVRYENMVLTVDSVEKNRIDKIRVRFLTEEEIEKEREEAEAAAEEEARAREAEKD